jgi:hypothetical protein
MILKIFKMRILAKKMPFLLQILLADQNIGFQEIAIFFRRKLGKNR